MSQELALALVASQAQTQLDPLASWSYVAPDGREYAQQRRFIESAVSGVETFLCGGNQTGKSTVGASLIVRLAQGVSQLANLELPVFTQPSVWWVLCQTREQQVESTQAAILKALGDWPHRIKYSQQFPEAAVLILVKPLGGGKNERSWSRIWFHVEGSARNTLPGGRVDGAWADEPPNIKRWREVRFRGRGNSLFLLMITATPINAQLWIPLRDDFADCDDQPRGGRLRITTTVFDNPFLSDQHKADLVEKARGDVHEAARLYGAYVDERGMCPFTNTPNLRSAMNRWRERCRKPELIETQVWNARMGPHGEVREPAMVVWEKYFQPEPDEFEVCYIDPSFGIQDREYDPGGIHVYMRQWDRLVARYHDYLEPYALGWLAAKMLQHFHPDDPGWMDVEVNRGLAEPVIRGARAAGHTKFLVELHDQRLHHLTGNRLGWETTGQNRGAMIGAVQTAMLEDSVLVVSRGVIDTMCGVIKTPAWKWEGEKDEDVILLGRHCHIREWLPPMTRHVPTTVQTLVSSLGVDPRLIQRTPAERVPDWGPGMS